MFNARDWRGAILVGYFTGARLMDVAQMKWDSIDLPTKLIVFTPGKTKLSKKQLEIPMHPHLEAYLLSLPAADKGSAVLFPSLASKGTGGAHGLSRTFTRIMTTAGIGADVARPKTGTRGRAVSKVSFHSWRHSFNSTLANAGVSQELRQKLTGHASAEVNKRYTHHEIEPLRAAIETLPGLK